MRGLLSRMLLIIGILLLAAAAVITVLTLYNKHINNISELLEGIEELIPDTHTAYTENVTDTRMPVVEYHNRDYIGILELPEYSRRLPILSEWNRRTVNHIPCRYTGSIYDSSLVIGTTDEKGCIDFTSELSVGDKVTFTDVSGARFELKISDITVSKDADSDTLCDGEYDLTVFVRNTLSFDYTIIRCTLH